MNDHSQENVSISEEDEDFDPMTDDYNDPMFNSYQTGPGSFINPNLHTQRRWEGEENQVYKLYISNIPLDIKDVGLLNIFSNFGAVQRVYLNLAKGGKDKFGFINYRTLREAERAIYSVNNVPPLNLSVKFSITDEAKQNRNILKFETPVCSAEKIEPPPTDHNSENKEFLVKSRGRGLLLAPMVGMKPSEMISSYVRPQDYKIPSSLSGSPLSRFSLPRTDPLLWSYHEALAYEKPVLSSDHRFIIALGRGQAIVNIIDESERYCLPATPERQSHHNVYEYNGSEGKNMAVLKSEPCCICSASAVRICFHCQKRFCSKICFRSDPPNHVISSNGLVICYKTTREGEDKDRNQGVFVKRLIFPPINFVDVPLTDSFPERPRPLSNRNSHLTRDILIVTPPSLTVNEKSGEQIKLEKDKGESSFPAGPLPFDSSTQVVVWHTVCRGVYYVNPCYLWDELMEMTDILNLMASRKQEVPLPTLNSIYIYLFQEVWCRAKVVQTEPELRIFYIDYGNEETASISNFRELPTSMSTSRFPPMAVKIKVVEEGDDKWLDEVVPPTKIIVRPISKEGDSYTVKVEREGPTSPKHSHTHTSHENKSHLECSHVLRAVEDCSSFELTVTAVVGPGRLCGTLNLNPTFVHSTPESMEHSLAVASSTHLPLDRVKLGDMVGCMSEDGALKRGYISSLVDNVGARVALVDEACVCLAARLFPLPEELLITAQTGVFCQLDTTATEIQVGCKLKCSRGTLLKKTEEVECEVERYGSAVLTAWRPRVEDVGLTTVALSCGSSVTISSYYSAQDVYVQSLESKYTALLDTLLQDVAAYASSANGLKREPELGEVVACLYPEDRNFYRAQVYKRIGNIFTVIFLDYGNSCDVTIDLMKPLPESLKMVPCCAVRIQLDGVKENLLTAGAVHLLNINANKPLYLELDKSEKSYILKTKEGISINGKIEELTCLKWKICLEQGTDPTNGEVFFGYDVKYLKWESNRKGKLLVVRVLSEDSCLVMETGDGGLDLTKEYFTPRYTDYCLSFAKHYQYTPRLKEICLVSIRDGQGWFRAVCTAVYEISCWVVLVDFGTSGEVYFTNIRPITYELMQLPSILKKCTVRNPSGTKKKQVVLKEGLIYEATILKESLPGIITADFENISSI